MVLSLQDAVTNLNNLLTKLKYKKALSKKKHFHSTFCLTHCEKERAALLKNYVLVTLGLSFNFVSSILLNSVVLYLVFRLLSKKPIVIIYIFLSETRDSFLFLLRLGREVPIPTGVR